VNSHEHPNLQPRPLMLGLGWFPDSLGGLDRYYRSLLEHLPDSRGVVIGPAGDAPERVEAVSGPRAPLPRRLAAFRRASLRAADRTDLVDAHFALYALWPMYSRGLRDKPAVFHFHGPWALESAAAGERSRLRLGLRRLLERAALRRAQRLIVLSGAFRRVLVEDYRISPWLIDVCPPGVELDRFTTAGRRQARERLGVAPETFLAVCARRLVPRMGIDVLLDAWAALAGELPPGSELLVIGEGPEGERLRARAQEPGLAGRVRMLGRVGEEDLIEAYRAADVAVVPSLAFEGFGMVVLEAAACGTPSIVSDVGGLPEALAGLDRSLVVPAGDAEALAERLLQGARGELPAREASRSHAEHFDWREVAERHRDIYTGVLAGGHRERPRVVYLDHVARLSGGEIALLRVLPHLRDVEAHVILGEEGPLASRLAQAGVSVEVLPIAAAARDVRKDSVGVGGTSPLAMLQTLTYVLRLAARLRALRPDLVHTNSLKSGVYGALAARLAGVPVLWHLRDRLADDYLSSGGLRLARTSIARLADGVIANSRSTLSTLAPSRRNRFAEVLPDSVQAPEPPARPSGTHEGTVFGMLGRIAPWKGQDLFLSAFADAFPDGPERAVIVGTPMFGEEDYERSLAHLIAELGLSERVELRGFREDIWPELASFDVLVHASITPEPFGQVVLEGMAAGLPVIAADEGGPAEVIADGRTGVLFRSGDRLALRDAMTTLGDSPAERERLGRAAAEAVGDYAPAVIAGRLQAVYERLLGDRSPA
jgi:glycosyltransferase involved in cell wall biosynthesis